VPDFVIAIYTVWDFLLWISAPAGDSHQHIEGVADWWLKIDALGAHFVLLMGAGCKRLTRLTYAFSKKWDNLKAALALHFAHYNFCRVHGSLRVTRSGHHGSRVGACGVISVARGTG
jgi:hypothetical protein